MFCVIMGYINIIYVPATTLALALTLDLGENRLDQARASKSYKINTIGIVFGTTFKHIL